MCTRVRIRHDREKDTHTTRGVEAAISAWQTPAQKMALAKATKMDAVPSPNTKPLATSTMRLPWLCGRYLSHPCSMKAPMTRGMVKRGEIYIPCSSRQVVSNCALA